MLYLLLEGEVVGQYNQAGKAVNERFLPEISACIQQSSIIRIISCSQGISTYRTPHCINFDIMHYIFIILRINGKTHLLLWITLSKILMHAALKYRNSITNSILRSTLTDLKDENFMRSSASIKHQTYHELVERSSLTKARLLGWNNVPI